GDSRFKAGFGPVGTKFSYASVEPEVLGLVHAAAVGRPVAEYLQEKIWQPIGAEADATWIIDRAGQEVTFCCFNAVLRDYARLGLLLAHDGNWRGRQIVPAAWIRDATSVRTDQPHLRPRTATPFFGYGYQTWIFPEDRRMFAFLGVRGQAIYVDPASRLVLVTTAVRKLPRDPGGAETVALWRAVTRDLARCLGWRPPTACRGDWKPPAPGLSERGSGASRRGHDRPRRAQTRRGPRRGRCRRAPDQSGRVG